MKQKKNYSPSSRLGILGGGQLARMLALQASRLGFQVHILSENKSDPAAQVTSFWHQGNPLNLVDLKKFIKSVDHLTFESEFYDGQIIMDQIKKSKKSITLHPSAEILGKIQDRLNQKNLLKESRLPTANYIQISSKRDLILAQKMFDTGFVLKLRKNGYDGYGTWICKKKGPHWTYNGKRSLPDFKKQPCIAEELIDIKKEFAIILVRSIYNEIVHFPLVQTIQKESRCDFVVGPENHKDISNMTKKISSMLQTQNYIGAIGIEFFQTTKNKLLINELAPRVHNTGHYTQLVFTEDQFLLHIKSVCGLHIEQPHLLSQNFCMVNLIGSGKKIIELPKKIKGDFHWYGKTESKPGRKMGHINYMGSNKKDLSQLALKERKGFKL